MMMMDPGRPVDQSLAQRMVRDQVRARGVLDEPVLQAMSRLPRHLFVPHCSLEEAYADRALPTAEGQTISQPYMVALMTDLLRVRPGQRVLEVGTGSGYQTALLALLGAEVVTIEQSRWLSSQARRVLTELGLASQVVLIVGDGTAGWPGGAPYDRILVTAAAPYLPKAYDDQLAAADGGRIVIPIGDRQEQVLTVYERRGGKLAQVPGLGVACRFVPLVGQDGWKTDNQ